MKEKEILQLLMDIWDDTSVYAGEDSLQEFMYRVRERLSQSEGEE